MAPTPTLQRSHTFSFYGAFEGLEISRSDGIGRTVTAYATVYNTPVEVDGFYYIADDPFEDDYGPHLEQIRRSAFDKTIRERHLDFQVLFNHGMDIFGNPAERYAMPLGTPLKVESDARGLLTVTRYAATPLADEVIELINNGSIRGQSFRGRVINASLTPRKSESDLDLVEFTEIALKEYGPCTFPKYPEATMESVRADAIKDRIERLTPKERELLIARLSVTPSEAAASTSEPGPTPVEPPAATAPGGRSLKDLLAEQEHRRRPR